MAQVENIKVLHVITRADIGGISSLLYNYYTNMLHGNVVFHVVAIETSYTQRYQQIFEDLGMHVFLMPEKITRRLRYLKRLIRQERYDVVHAHVELVSAVYLATAMLAGTRVRVSHTHLAVDNTGLKNKILQMLLNRVATHRVGCSKRAIAKLFGSKYVPRATVVYNAIDPHEYVFDPLIRQTIRQELQIHEKYVVGFVGRLTALKNIPYLLEVFKALKHKKKDVVLLLVGEGEMQGILKTKIEEIGLSPDVKFLGARIDVNQLLMAMDVLLFPSFSEGFGLVMVEAQATALKCIASLDGVSKETSISNYSYYEAIEKPAEVWADLILDKCVDYERVNMEQEVAKHHFDVRIEANKLIDFYNRAVQGS
ncbi:glycosyltransferase family 1 protein [Sphingobacterium phlebotomi]|uniref:Glycosyltransferase family 1 protein n=1 Tax=Sphingobacterium phlebotomi TaxID=2605433 RepID=A0A5D4H8C7_9SPHI|nr:glycosyltransferase [Sphingobacterium phlebotomi]TYR36532.1 glycosyltransferase family 1 protein [Sphingobacterium phlebotomi]